MSSENQVKYLQGTSLAWTLNYLRLSAIENLTNTVEERMMKRLLIVDDEADHRLILRTILESCGYACEEAEDGMGALEQLAMTPMDLVLTDMNMPKMNGFQLIDTMAKFSLFSRIPVIIMTSQSMEGRSIEASKTGTWTLISKPYDFPKLLEAVNRAIGQFEPVCNASRS
ncbi:MAG: response regulator [Nitrospirota bacterium]|nr:response regulator [Nitrospirota bacterium]MDH5586670.1 response regulator [Nitrospirota bacterium]MDH5775168.1 response regulator [Nitrospirota bacterium]